MLSSRELVGLLADPVRRAVFAALVLGEDEVQSLSRRSGSTVRETATALDRFVGAGLVEEIEPGRFVLLAQAFERAARSEAAPAEPSEFGDEPEERRRVLERAMRHGRLVRLPARRSRRLIVLDHLAQRFEPGRRYTERQVNAILAEVDADTATLRRYLVDEAMLDRADGEYWRIGGTFPVED